MPTNPKEIALHEYRANVAELANMVTIARDIRKDIDDMEQVLIDDTPADDLDYESGNPRILANPQNQDQVDTLGVLHKMAQKFEERQVALAAAVYMWLEEDYDRGLHTLVDHQK